jgi:hypothetical protein
VSPTDAAWAQIDTEVLTALARGRALTAGEVLPDQPRDIAVLVLSQNVHAGLVAARYDASRTTYTITEAGRKHLANTKAMA